MTAATVENDKNVNNDKKDEEKKDDEKNDDDKKDDDKKDVKKTDKSVIKSSCNRFFWSKNCGHLFAFAIMDKKKQLVIVFVGRDCYEGRCLF